MMSLTVLSLPQRYKRLLQAMSLAVAVVYMTLLLYQSAYGYPGMQVSLELCLPTVCQGCQTQRERERDLCVCFAGAVHLRSLRRTSLSLSLLACLAPSFYVSCTFINQRWRRLQLRMRPAPASFQPPLSLSPALSLPETFLRPSQRLEVCLCLCLCRCRCRCLAYKTVSVFSNFILLSLLYFFLLLFLFLSRCVSLPSAARRQSFQSRRFRSLDCLYCCCCSLLLFFVLLWFFA